MGDFCFQVSDEPLSGFSHLGRSSQTPFTPVDHQVQLFKDSGGDIAFRAGGPWEEKSCKSKPPLGASHLHLCLMGLKRPPCFLFHSFGDLLVILTDF